jgi:hypothetical protein
MWTATGRPAPHRALPARIATLQNEEIRNA